ncbi:MAG: MoaD/ThiS family protein [Candidatus Rokubacteria bacterium]|nr:MoaD/ThiS family protein [Candidatus Rokubacteria bacterium]MBI2543651.1 MoaD/ThiS family protein [Candidatus Rokubacteria bacterium]MBI2554963.1 MoaD/ThiS family protein [Candidatus Rokubacteria bacterium]
MKIEVRLFATLAVYLPEESDGRSATREVPEGSTVAQVVRSLGIPDDVPFITMINGRDAVLNQPLADGDVLSLFPPLAGGR